jgi:hypothetical protein
MAPVASQLLFLAGPGAESALVQSVKSLAGDPSEGRQTRLIIIKLYSRMRRACSAKDNLFVGVSGGLRNHNVSQMRGLIIIVVVLVAASAMRHGSYRPLPTAPMPAVNVP